MKKVVFYFNDGSYKSIYGYGSTDRERISDAKSSLNRYEIEEIENVSVLEPMTSEF